MSLLLENYLNTTEKPARRLKLTASYRKKELSYKKLSSFSIVY